LASDSRQRTFLIAPDSFKGTFSATEVAEAIARGVRDTGAAADPCPVADGGEGTVDALLAAVGGSREPASAHDPLGRPIETWFALLDDGTAVVETAAASGLGLVAEDKRDPELASTGGTGELIAAAAEAGARRVLLAVGGSATTDGGAGAIEAIAERGGLRGAELEVLCDVRTPFERAAQVFAPQKGADPEAVARLRRRLDELAATLPRDPRGVPMTGCAGGLSGGLWAALGARLHPGAKFVLDALGFDRRLRAATAAIGGEGRLDAQTLEGKVLAEIAARCGEAGRPMHAIVGTDQLGPGGAARLGLETVVAATTLEEIRKAARVIAARG
jgi:glycerate 2-kinase